MKGAVPSNQVPSNQALVLASESSYRRALLDRLALPYTARSHRLDERAHQREGSLAEHALALARAKADSLSTLEPNAHIIASDQIAELDGEILHKPGTRSRAIAQLSQLQARTHRLLTAVALRDPAGNTVTSLDEHSMHMRSLSTREIERYVDSDKPFDCCGSYKIESLGISLFSSIEGEDFTAITGLPLIALSNMLRGAGFSVP
jgi:septum formation protein